MATNPKITLLNKLKKLVSSASPDVKDALNNQLSVALGSPVNAQTTGGTAAAVSTAVQAGHGDVVLGAFARTGFPLGELFDPALQEALGVQESNRLMSLYAGSFANMRDHSDNVIDARSPQPNAAFAADYEAGLYVYSTVRRVLTKSTLDALIDVLEMDSKTRDMFEVAHVNRGY